MIDILTIEHIEVILNSYGHKQKGLSELVFKRTYGVPRLIYYILLYLNDNSIKAEDKYKLDDDMINYLFTYYEAYVIDMLIPYKNIADSHRKLYHELLLFAAFQIPISPDVTLPIRLLDPEIVDKPIPIAMVNRVLQVYTRRASPSGKIYIIVPEMILMTARIRKSYDIRSIIYDDLSSFHDSTGRIRSNDLENISAGSFVSHILRLRKLIEYNTLSDVFQFLKNSNAKDILISDIPDKLPQKFLPKIVTKCFVKGTVIPIDYEEHEKEKIERKIAIKKCLDGDGGNILANTRDWKYIYECLGDIFCSIIPPPQSVSADYLFYMGKFTTVIGIQQKSEQAINSKLIAEEAEKFNPVNNFTHILFIIGFGEIKLKNLEDNCKNYKILETGTIFFFSIII